jgi:hypothetical protein
MRSSYSITKLRWHTAFTLCASWARSFSLATSVGLLLVPIEAGRDEFPMNFCRRVTKTRIIHRSAWNRISRKSRFTHMNICPYRGGAARLSPTPMHSILHKIYWCWMDMHNRVWRIRHLSVPFFHYSGEHPSLWSFPLTITLAAAPYPGEQL